MLIITKLSSDKLSASNECKSLSFIGLPANSFLPLSDLKNKMSKLPQSMINVKVTNGEFDAVVMIMSGQLCWMLNRGLVRMVASY